MKTTIAVLQNLVRLCFLILLALGIAFWTGHWFALMPLHMSVGILLVLGLWSTSILAATARVPAGLVIAGIVWGVIVIAFGMKQMTLLTGSAHWVVQAGHLLVGMAAIGLNERLARLTQQKTLNRSDHALSS